ncbi:hypothetical protein AB4K20DRAFT_1973838 [Rhizopus microsporus]
MTRLSAATFPVPFFLYFNMKRKKDDDPPPPKPKRNKGKGICRSRAPFFVCTGANKLIQLMLKAHINKQKGTQEIVKRFFDNSKKYGKTSTVGAKNQNPNKIKHVPLPPVDLPSSSQRKRIIAFGNGSFVKYERRITEEIKRKCKQSNGRTEFVSVDEYLTSQICNKCKSKQLNNISITGSKRRVHSVSQVALNIYNIFVYKSKHDNESPAPFKRPSED